MDKKVEIKNIIDGITYVTLRNRLTHRYYAIRGESVEDRVEEFWDAFYVKVTTGRFKGTILKSYEGYGMTDAMYLSIEQDASRLGLSRDDQFEYLCAKVGRLLTSSG